MPRYSISNAPTEIAVCQLDPAEIGGDWGISSLSIEIRKGPATCHSGWPCQPGLAAHHLRKMLSAKKPIKFVICVLESVRYA